MKKPEPVTFGTSGARGRAELIRIRKRIQIKFFPGLSKSPIKTHTYETLRGAANAGERMMATGTYAHMPKAFRWRVAEVQRLGRVLRRMAAR